MIRGLFLCAAATMAAFPASAQDLGQVIAAYERFTLDHPMEAGRSDPSRARTGWPREAPAAMAERRAGLAGLREQLARVRPAESGEERINRDYLDQLIGWRIEGIDFDERRFAFMAHEGFYNTPYYAARSTRIANDADAQAWIAQLSAIPAYFAEQRANLERGIATGWTQPAQVVDAAVAVLRNHVAHAPEADPLLEPLKASSADPARLAEAVRVVAEKVRPAQREMLSFIDGRYRRSARADIGIASVPDGRAYYDFLLRYYTTTALSAEQIHEMGLAEVRRIRTEMERVIGEAGFSGSFAEWLHFLRTDPRFYARSREELIDQASAAAKRIDGALPRYFRLLPRQPFTVQPVPRDVEEGYTTARYSGGDFSRGFPGIFLVNTSHLDQRPLYELPALALHEAAPGHHTHFALTSELESLPAFRRQRDMLAYREGWALYAERLGHEMGIYRDSYEAFGALSTEMWRACRMVVDTGIHVMNWTYAQARACFTDNTALADINIDTELARYIGAPGGAVAYKVGELKIVELRQRAEQRLGDAFDLRAFHDLVLAQGQVPMEVLDRLVDEWIGTQLDSRS